MSETSPLLADTTPAQQVTRPHEHPIFLRVVHSPWTFIGQKALLLSRVSVMVYMTVVLSFCLDSEINNGGNPGLFVFYIGYISYMFQLLYFWLTSIWTFQHFVSPQNRPQRDHWSFVDRTMSFVSIPRTTEFTAAKRYFFSVFYAAAMVFPFVVSFLHFFVLDQMGELNSAPLLSNETDAKTNWLIISVFISSPATALLEIFFLSSIRQIQPFVDHTVGLALITGLYYAWARLGEILTGEWTYAAVDSITLTNQELFVNITTSIALSTSMFLVIMGVHEIRDIVAKKAECDRVL